MPTLLLTYANSDTNKLPTLTQEYDGVNQALRERFANGDFVVVSESFTTPEKIIELIRSHERQIAIFAYSGHAGRDRLLLEEGEAYDRGIANLLGRCPGLKLVLLNGCSTAGQVNALKEKGVPVVIATSAPVNDYAAMQFAVSFFKELIQRRATVREAFERAVGAAEVRGKTGAVEITSRGLGADATEEAMWGLYYDEAKKDILDGWRLPENTDTAGPSNQYLRNTLELIFEEQLKNEAGPVDAQEFVLRRLPYLISEPLRKLLAPRDSSNQLFYDTPSESRVKMLLYAYRSLINFMAVSLLGQLWKEKSIRERLELGQLADELKKWLTKDSRLEAEQSSLMLYQQLVQCFRENGIPFFFDELTAIVQEFEVPTTHESIGYLESKLASLSRLNEENIVRLCDESEQHLAVVLYYYGFLVHYSLTSVKDIEVLYYMHQSEVEYAHKVVRLQQQVTALEDGVETMNIPYKTASILLRSVKDKARSLYLSPFLIDENAYTKTTKANLRYFASFDRTNKQFKFKQVSKPDDVLSIEKKFVSALAKIKGEKSNENDFYQLINEQFSAYCKLVLGQTLDAL